METTKKVYECFSPRQAKFLEGKGFKYFDEYNHNTTKKKCFKFHMTDDLSAALTEWTNTNPNKKAR